MWLINEWWAEQDLVSSHNSCGNRILGIIVKLIMIDLENAHKTILAIDLLGKSITKVENILDSN